MQVKLSAIEIKVEFPPLQETFEQDFSLLMNDFSNLFRRKESMARNHADDNWSRKFQYDPLIKVMLRSILHWTKFSDNITNLFLNKKNGTNVFHSHYDGVSGGRQIWMDINQVRTKSLVLKTVKKNCHSIDVVVFTSSENLSTKKPCSFLESLDISKQWL